MKFCNEPVGQARAEQRGYDFKRQRPDISKVAGKYYSCGPPANRYRQTGEIGGAMGNG